MASAVPASKVVADPFEFPLVGSLDPNTTALLVIDFQRDFTEEGGYVAGMGYDITPLAAPIPIAAEVLAACRKVGMHIIFTRQGFRADLADLTEYEIAKFARAGVVVGSEGPLGKFFVRGQPGWEINPKVAPLETETIVDKTANCAFVGTDLDLILKSKGIDRLVVVGNTLDCCVHCTSLEE